MIKPITIATLDTETVGLEGHIYDIGYCIHNKRGEIVLERNWLVEENFTNPKRMMGSVTRSVTRSVMEVGAREDERQLPAAASSLQDGDRDLTALRRAASRYGVCVTLSA